MIRFCHEDDGHDDDGDARSSFISPTGVTALWKWPFGLLSRLIILRDVIVVVVVVGVVVEIETSVSGRDFEMGFGAINNFGGLSASDWNWLLLSF